MVVVVVAAVGRCSLRLIHQDLATWPAMKEAKRLYLIATERRENPEQAAANDAAAAAEAEAAATAANATTAAGDSGMFFYFVCRIPPWTRGNPRGDEREAVILIMIHGS